MGYANAQVITIEAVKPEGDVAHSYNYIYPDSSALACIDRVGSEAGSGLGFEHRGEHRLKGIAEPIDLLATRRGA